MKNITGKIFIFSEWVMNLFLLQLYWILGSLVGGIIVGIVPSSIAMFATIRELYNSPEELNILYFFKNEYKKNFKTSLFISVLYFLSFSLSYIYSLFLSFTTESWLAYTHILMYINLIIIFLFTLYLIPVFIHYEIENKHLVSTTIIILLNSLKWNLPMLFSLLAITLIFIKYAVVFFFFGISLPSFLIFYFTMKAFKDFDRQREKI